MTTEDFESLIGVSRADAVVCVPTTVWSPAPALGAGEELGRFPARPADLGAIAAAVAVARQRRRDLLSWQERETSGENTLPPGLAN
ncbi:hypothetical protein GCM10010435_94880 [Winogradskya consettensis]|uniref:Uncharacterized protein n=1 Tax=Winogradskya consettensis TaxID=113560 RepID=A0A919W4U9_9ACTN|nr:hypothetical protein [Actinoplanes consettensis]GIM79798.1 hypothetical protein Aco04nite_67340 [Actinoplanes consettensis]